MDNSLDPRCALSIISWNCGGLTTQLDGVRSLLMRHSPAVLLLQEACNASGVYSILKAECATLGYSVTADPSNHLVAIFRHGLSIAPLRAAVGDSPFRIQRLALLVSGRRFVIRHVHGPSQKGAERTNFMTHMEAEEVAGALVIDAGDFNHVPLASTWMHKFFPGVPTFRRSMHDDTFGTELDGFRLSSQLCAGAALNGIPPYAEGSAQACHDLSQLLH